MASDECFALSEGVHIADIRVGHEASSIARVARVRVRFVEGTANLDLPFGQHVSAHFDARRSKGRGKVEVAQPATEFLVGVVRRKCAIVRMLNRSVGLDCRFRIGAARGLWWSFRIARRRFGCGRYLDAGAFFTIASKSTGTPRMCL